MAHSFGSTLVYTSLNMGDIWSQRKQRSSGSVECSLSTLPVS